MALQIPQSLSASQVIPTPFLAVSFFGTRELPFTSAKKWFSEHR
jgi:hypothetical protein